MVLNATYERSFASRISTEIVRLNHAATLPTSTAYRGNPRSALQWESIKITPVLWGYQPQTHGLVTSFNQTLKWRVNMKSGYGGYIPLRASVIISPVCERPLSSTLLHNMAGPNSRKARQASATSKDRYANLSCWTCACIICNDCHTGRVFSSRTIWRSNSIILWCLETCYRASYGCRQRAQNPNSWSRLIVPKQNETLRCSVRAQNLTPTTFSTSDECLKGWTRHRRLWSGAAGIPQQVGMLASSPLPSKTACYIPWPTAVDGLGSNPLTARWSLTGHCL